MSSEAITSPRVTTAASGATAWTFVPLLGQLTLATAVVFLFSIEGESFGRLFALTVAGFAVNLVLPLQIRLPFFVALSLAGIVMTLGPIDAGWIVAGGLLLIGLCQLPGPNVVRVSAVVAAGALLAVARAGWFGVPWSGAVWPVLGSMFMFRLALYLYATPSGGKKVGGFWHAVAYFFMLPNVAFPLYPVVDYQTFVRTYYDRDHKAIYEQGMGWIARGLVHLLLYRLVYQRFLGDPVDVSSLGDLVQLMLSTFLLYLRVSGQFHLIVGILHLFGFRLPETHKLYYLSHSFTELWRRINIYWTEFMMKLVFYPTYFRVKRLGPTRALVVSTIVVFIATWFLHSYQWFWLRGGFPVTAQDTLFWGMLGALVAAGALRELKTPTRKTLAKGSTWDGRMAVKAVATFAAFCFLWSLWSTESMGQWIWGLGMAFNVDVKGVVLIAGTVLIIGLLGGRDWSATAALDGPGWLRAALQPSVRTTATLALLTVAGLPVVARVAPGPLAEGLTALHTTGLNALDTENQHRGYYEQLDVRNTPNALAVNGAGPADGWTEIVDLGIVRDRADFMLLDLQPSRSVVWNGKRFSTNRWGMRDQDYTLVKPAGTLRIALLGPSHIMGDNVPDGQTFATLLERRLNAEFRLGPYERFEILNFAMPGFSILQQVAMLDDRVFDFSPDVVIVTKHTSERELTERTLERVIRGDVAVPYEDLNNLLLRAGLEGAEDGSVPIPFEFWRTVARRLGVDPRMPFGEAAARIRRITKQSIEWSYRRFASETRARGAQPAVLALNVVVERVPDHVPDQPLLSALKVPVLNLFDVYPRDRLEQLRVAPWDDHPNAEAHKIIAERLYPELVRFLQSLPQASASPPSRSH